MLREFICEVPSCPARGAVVEHFRHPSEDANPEICPACGGEMRRLLSRFGVVFTGALTARYNDKNRPYAHREGHWAWERNTPDGKPRPVFIDSFQAQKEYCAREGLLNPKDLPTGQTRLVTKDDHDAGLRRLLDIPYGDKPSKLTTEQIRQAGGAVQQELTARGMPGQEV